MTHTCTAVNTVATGRLPSIFKRYDITDEADLIEVAARLDEKRQAQLQEKSQAPKNEASEFTQSSRRTGDFCTTTAATAQRKLKAAVLPN